jgi:HPt (histidine-containing phosphotransfer) domain-containing protein
VGEESGVLDSERIAILKELDGGDGSLLSELAKEYESDALSQLEAMRVALDSTDAGGLERAAHCLKGASANLGATAVAAGCREIEQLARGGDIAGVGRLIDDVESELRIVYAALGQVAAGA